MANEFEHLRIEKEPFSNPRRSGRPPHFAKRSDLVGHARHLSDSLAVATQTAKQQISSRLDSYVLKLKYEATLTFNSLNAHGNEFISQEDSQLCVVFTTEQGLATFADHLARLGLNDEDITGKQLLEALVSIEAWDAEDRKSWAIKQYGFPQDSEINVDLELWPVELIGSPKRNQLIEAFEKWLVDSEIKKKDSVNLDSFLMYRVVVDKAGIEKLLNHTDVRLVDLPPRSGIDYQTINRDIDSVPTGIPAPDINAPRVCILDSGINSNHLLRGTGPQSGAQ